VIRLWNTYSTKFTACKGSDLLRWCEKEPYVNYGFTRKGYEETIEWLETHRKDLLVFSTFPLSSILPENYYNLFLRLSEKTRNLLDTIPYVYEIAKIEMEKTMKDHEEWVLKDDRYRNLVEDIGKIVGLKYKPLIKKISHENNTVEVIHVGLPKNLRKECEKIAEKYGYQIEFKRPKNRGKFAEEYDPEVKSLRRYRRWQIESGKYFQI
jgi:hypothetical protein